jgi:group II intron reverse transcriptase/maturase
MRNPAKVLNGLSEHSEDPNYKFERLYRVLFNEEMYYVAYQRIYANPGNMTPGSDGKTIDNMSLSRIDELISSLRNEAYQPEPSRRVYIPKKNGKMRPLGIPAFEDKLLQEVVRMVLEAIYERSFEYCSHGFRPNKSCHTALAQIHKTYNGAKWFIEGDIKGFFDNINHDVMINILKERITDERFIRLIRKFLNAGYLEDWKLHKTYSGTPQGGIVSPLLANIYLDKLDKYMKEYILKFNKGKKKEPNPERVKFERKSEQCLKKLRKVKDENERAELVREIKTYQKDRVLVPSTMEMDENFKRLKYVRYADDFLIGIIGSKEDAKTIKEDVKNFLNEKLALELSEDKTLITHTETPANFLGYEIYVRKSNQTRRDKIGRLRRSFNMKVMLKLPMDTVKKKLLEYEALELKMLKGKETWKPKARGIMVHNDDLEILDRYNSEIRGFYNYYSIAYNSSAVLGHFYYIMKYSMYKTFAWKYRTYTSRIAAKYKRDGVFTVQFKNSKGQPRTRLFYHDGFKRKTTSIEKMDVDNIKNYAMYTSATSLIDRLKAQICELCGGSDNLNMHHVRNIKDLDNKKTWERKMIERQRKTIAVCRSCHSKIHHGTIGRSISGEPDTLRGVSPVRGRVYENLIPQGRKASDA